MRDWNLRVACLQMSAGSCVGDNIQKAESLIRRASRRGVQLACLPEFFHYRGPRRNLPGVGETLDGNLVRFFQALAAKEKIAILMGSFYEKAKKRGFWHNTSVLIDEKGKRVAHYRKIHLFRINAGKSLKASEPDYLRPGSKVETAQWRGVAVGFSICFDLRFPAMYREMAVRGAEVMFVPSNFTAYTGKAHWETLLRARAIENQAYMIAPNQFGKGYRDGIEAFGTSLIVNPWGRVLAKAGRNREEIIEATLRSGEISGIRKSLSVLHLR